MVELIRKPPVKVHGVEQHFSEYYVKSIYIAEGTVNVHGMERKQSVRIGWLAPKVQLMYMSQENHSLGRYSERTAVQVFVDMKVVALHSIWWEMESGRVYGYSNILDSGDVCRGSVCT